MSGSGMTASDAVTTRELVRTAKGMPASDGDGVRLTRIIGSPELDMIDPFLLLDCFESDRPDDYIGGFPDHPHRGFETVTYLVAGRMRHKDNAGHEGVIEPGGVQWMTAGRGVIHSEMPEQEEGLLQGFQLWVNLPAAEKMSAPAYQEFPVEQIPAEAFAGGTVRVIAGVSDRGAQGPVKPGDTAPLYLDVSLDPGAVFHQRVPGVLNGFIYVFEGAVNVGVTGAALPAGTIGILGEGDQIEVSTRDAPGRFLVIAGKPIGEPVARGGPFVMNTRQEILQAFQDFQHGRF